MLKSLKIICLGLIFILAAASVTIEMPFMQEISNFLPLPVYIRLASVLSLLALVFWIWGNNRKITTSQKYTRAKEILTEAENQARRKNEAGIQLEERLKAAYAQKEQGLEARIQEVEQECRERLKELKKQNMELKESAANLMAALKEKNVK